jgi:hypothetical protein
LIAISLRPTACSIGQQPSFENNVPPSHFEGSAALSVLYFARA